MAYLGPADPEAPSGVLYYDEKNDPVYCPKLFPSSTPSTESEKAATAASPLPRPVFDADPIVDYYKLYKTVCTRPSIVHFLTNLKRPLPPHLPGKIVNPPSTQTHTYQWTFPVGLYLKNYGPVTSPLIRLVGGKDQPEETFQLEWYWARSVWEPNNHLGLYFHVTLTFQDATSRQRLINEGMSTLKISLSPYLSTLVSLKHRDAITSGNQLTGAIQVLSYHFVLGGGIWDVNEKYLYRSLTSGFIRCEFLMGYQGWSIFDEDEEEAISNAVVYEGYSISEEFVLENSTAFLSRVEEEKRKVLHLLAGNGRGLDETNFHVYMLDKTDEITLRMWPLSKELRRAIRKTEQLLIALYQSQTGVRREDFPKLFGEAFIPGNILENFDLAVDETDPPGTTKRTEIRSALIRPPTLVKFDNDMRIMIGIPGDNTIFTESDIKQRVNEWGSLLLSIKCHPARGQLVDEFIKHLLDDLGASREERATWGIELEGGEDGDEAA